MLYVIYGRDCEDSLELRAANRPAHLERLEALQAEGRLLIAGPLPAIDSPDPGSEGLTGSLIIAQFDSLEEAKKWAEADPYRAAGVYTEVEVKPFKKVLPHG